MTSDTPNTSLIGFEKDPALEETFASFGIFHDYRTALPEHVLGVLRQQHPSVILESIELLNDPKYNLGGMLDEPSETIIRVQTLEIPLDLRVTLRVESERVVLDIRLVIHGEGLDSNPGVKSDMFIQSQRAVE